MWKCRKCPTEYRIDFKFCNGHGWSRFFTRWKDLGSDLDGKVWAQHLSARVAPRPTRLIRALFEGVSDRDLAELRNQVEGEAQVQEGNLSFAFEGTDDFDFESLLIS